MFNKINQAAAKPVIWSAYSAETLWADSHIAKQMLAYHLNPELSVASRTAEFIEQSVDWLIQEFDLDAQSKVIDFGCGPGLYTQKLKTRGVGTVVGLDFSQNSLSYATEKASSSRLDIEYHYGNYLDYNDDRKFDLITLVMCDFCALSPSQRATLLSKFKSMLAPKGSIALDVYTASRFDKQEQSLTIEKNSMNGFWSDTDYWCIQSSFNYQDEMVTLDKYTIYQDNKEWVVYNWLQHFTIEMLANELKQHGLVIQARYGDLRGRVYSDNDEVAVIVGHE